MHVRLQDLVRERLSKMFIILTIKKEWSFIFNNEERYLWFSGVIGIVKRQLSIRHRWFPIRNFDIFGYVLKDFYMTKGGGGVLKLSALTWGRRGRVRSLYRGFKLTFSRNLLISGSPPLLITIARTLTSLNLLDMLFSFLFNLFPLLIPSLPGAGVLSENK